MRTITSPDMVGPFGVAAVVKDLTQPKLPHNAALRLGMQYTNVLTTSHYA
jgi:hypothetical protein